MQHWSCLQPANNGHFSLTGREDQGVKANTGDRGLRGNEKSLSIGVSDLGPPLKPDPGWFHITWSTCKTKRQWRGSFPH